MHRQFAKTEEVMAESVALPRDAARHLLTVLRLGIGDSVELFDGAGASATFTLSPAASVEVGGVPPRTGSAAQNAAAPSPRSLLREGRLLLLRDGPVRHAPPRPRPLILAACVSKGARMDWTIEKAVELGATKVLPVLSGNCVVSVRNAADAEAHRQRWRRIAIEASRQCGTAYLPEIAAPCSLVAALAALAADGAEIFAGGLVPDAIPFRDALAARRARPAPTAVAWAVGPEGDFSLGEYDALRSAGATLVSLGSLVLRTETAAVFGLCVLSTEW